MLVYLKEIDVTPKVVRLPEDLDPDEYILKYGSASFKAMLDNPVSWVEFLMNQHKLNKNLTDIEDITKYINESLNDLLSVEDTILIDLTLKKMSDEYKVAYATLKDKYIELKKKQKPKSVSLPKEKKVKLSQQTLAARNLLFYMLKDEEIIKEVEKKVTFFPDNNIRSLANQIIYH